LVILFSIVAVDQLDLASQLFDKSTWLNCSLDKPWFGLDFGPDDLGAGDLGGRLGLASPFIRRRAAAAGALARQQRRSRHEAEGNV
jgi:hypothetical protein